MIISIGIGLNGISPPSDHDLTTIYVEEHLVRKEKNKNPGLASLLPVFNNTSRT